MSLSLYPQRTDEPPKGLDKRSIVMYIEGMAVKMTANDRVLFATTRRHPESVTVLNALADRIHAGSLPLSFGGTPETGVVRFADADEVDPFDVEADWKECHDEAADQS